jgi:hypothetical protein
VVRKESEAVYIQEPSHVIYPLLICRLPYYNMSNNKKDKIDQLVLILQPEHLILKIIYKTTKLGQ